MPTGAGNGKRAIAVNNFVPFVCFVVNTLRADALARRDYLRLAMSMTNRYFTCPLITRS
jgi:hypothetical protein